MAENRKVLGTKHDNGRVRSLRGYGQTFVAVARDNSEKCQRERMRRAMVTR